MPTGSGYTRGSRSTRAAAHPFAALSTGCQPLAGSVRGEGLTSRRSSCCRCNDMCVWLQSSARAYDSNVHGFAPSCTLSQTARMVGDGVLALMECLLGCLLWLAVRAAGCVGLALLSLGGVWGVVPACGAWEDGVAASGGPGLCCLEVA